MREEHCRDHGGPHGPKRRHLSQDDPLPDLLRFCGHILYHRHGWNRSQGRVLRLIEDRGRMSQKELQDLLGIKSSSISEMISKLEAKGLVRRERDDADKRKTVLVITDAGKAAVHDLPDRTHQESYDALSPEEQETLRQLLLKLLASWQEPENPSVNSSTTIE